MFSEPGRDSLTVRRTWLVNDLQRAPSHGRRHCQMGAGRGEWPRATSLVCPDRGAIADLLMFWGTGQALQGSGPQHRALQTSGACGGRVSRFPRQAAGPAAGKGRGEGPWGELLQLGCCCLSSAARSCLQRWALQLPRCVVRGLGTTYCAHWGGGGTGTRGGDPNGERMKLWELLEVTRSDAFLEAAALSPPCPARAADPQGRFLLRTSPEPARGPEASPYLAGAVSRGQADE